LEVIVVRRVISIATVLIFLLSVVACSSEDDSDPATKATIEEVSVEDAAPPVFHIETAVELIGQSFETAPDGYFAVGSVCTASSTDRPDDSPRLVLLKGQPDKDESSKDARRGYVIVAGQLPIRRCDFPLEITDAIWLATDDYYVWLAIQCTTPPGAEGPAALIWERPDGERQILRLWDYEPELERLIEIDPADRSPGFCESPRR